MALRIELGSFDLSQDAPLEEVITKAVSMVGEISKYGNYREIDLVNTLRTAIKSHLNGGLTKGVVDYGFAKGSFDVTVYRRQITVKFGGFAGSTHFESNLATFTIQKKVKNPGSRGARCYAIVGWTLRVPTNIKLETPCLEVKHALDYVLESKEKEEARERAKFVNIIINLNSGDYVKAFLEFNTFDSNTRHKFIMFLKTCEISSDHYITPPQ